MTLNHLFSLSLSLLLSFACGQTPVVVNSQASVEGQTLTSAGFPRGSITFDPSFTYIGVDTFVLYGVARCEIHLFAEADSARNVRRLFWVQFEGYLPDRNQTYDYSDDPRRTLINGFTFYDNVRYYNMEATAKNRRKGSDGEHVVQLLEKNGYRLGGDLMRIRLVRLDAAARSELMIIYSESLALQGLTVADLEQSPETWTVVSEGLRTRALAGMSISMQ
jgi:hypothetical protein